MGHTAISNLSFSWIGLTQLNTPAFGTDVMMNCTVIIHHRCCCCCCLHMCLFLTKLNSLRELNHFRLFFSLPCSPFHMQLLLCYHIHTPRHIYLLNCTKVLCHKLIFMQIYNFMQSLVLLRIGTIQPTLP